MIVAQNVANLYAEPSADAEMVTQAVLGARVIVEEEREGFCRVGTEDRYGGWIFSHLLAADDSVGAQTAIVTMLFAEVVSLPTSSSEMLTKLVAGSRVTIAAPAGYNGWVNIQMPDGKRGYVFQSRLHSSYAKPADLHHALVKRGIKPDDFISAIGRMVGAIAKHFIGTPYLWGGCTPFGIDCSGVTQLAYKLNGVQLLRDAHLQFGDRRFRRVEEGQSLETAVLEDGDLVAFSRREDKRPTHIGIALGDGRFIHARGGRGVRIDFCDTPEYVKTYVGTVRLSPDADLAVEAA